MRLEGRVTLDILQDALVANIAQPAWLLDCSQARLDLTCAEVVQLWMTLSDLRRRGANEDQPSRIALLVTGKTNYGVGRILQGYSGLANLDILTTYDANDAAVFLAE